MDTSEPRRVSCDVALPTYRPPASTGLLRVDTASTTDVADGSETPAARSDDVHRDLEERVETDDGGRGTVVDDGGAGPITVTGYDGSTEAVPGGVGA